VQHSRDLERRSAAVTLSDMEVFIFPELMYGLVLANIMSPRIWRWRDDPWFEGIETMTPYRRITRLKQYVMDHYAFNLDLDTWGLTTKPTEIERFKDFVSPEALAQSNALFGYEGDKYYFDIDIRTHFGLDKYEGDVIPYWKTETVEAMDAFRHKPEYDFGAGECVSLAALYAAALFIVAKIPLEDIFLMATPLHSQNFVDSGTGVLTNNRRLVTKNMWFNGTALSAQARRAMENERITVVAHESGCIHILFEDATIDPEAYKRFSAKLHHFLQTPLAPEILGNFIRQSLDVQTCFQVRWHSLGVTRYITMEKLLSYEYRCPYRFSDQTRDKLMAEVAGEDFESSPLSGRIIFDDLEQFIRDKHIDLSNPEDLALLRGRLDPECLNAQVAVEALERFCHVEPRLPNPAEKTFRRDQPSLGLDAHMSRDEIIERLSQIRAENELADLAFYAYRDLGLVDPAPFLKAAMERCPVSIAATADLTDEQVVATVRALVDESIYDGHSRPAQPDEVWNYGRGDGLEKALLLANILAPRHPEHAATIEITPHSAVLRLADAVVSFACTKELEPQLWHCRSLTVTRSD
jgi:hypothetical protein